MDALVQRVRSLATAAMPFAVRARDAASDPDRPAMRLPPGVRWALWVGLLILPGSFLLLPVLFWGKVFAPRRGLSRP